MGYLGRAESRPQIKEGEVVRRAGIRWQRRGSNSQKVPAGPVGSKLSYSAWTWVFLNQAGPWVDLRVEHLLPGSMSKAWEHCKVRAGVRQSQAQGWKGGEGLKNRPWPLPPKPLGLRALAGLGGVG